MSYRDMRKMMRALGYKRLISMVNFTKPLFPLMADIMTWLALRFEPNADIPRDIDSQQDRVIFIKYITEFMATKANTKVNPKKLYESDGYSVKEMIKVSQILYQAMLSSGNNDNDDVDGDGDDADGISAVNVMADLSSKADELKEARQMASELITKGALLHDLMGREVNLKLSRLEALSKQLELTDVEKTLNECDRNIQSETAKILSMIESVASDEANLEAKIEKKRAELERNRKRYESLQGVRPAYMDEFEKCEEELQQMFNDYLDKQKNSAFLEQIYEKYKKIEQDFSATLEIQLKKAMVHTQDRPGINILEAARKNIFPNNDNNNEDDDDDEDDMDNNDDEDDDEELIGKSNNNNRIAIDPFSKRIKSSYHSRGHKSIAKNNMMPDDEDDDEDDDELVERKLSNGDDDDDDDDDLKLDDEDDDEDDFGLDRKRQGRGSKPMGARGVRGAVRADAKKESDDDDF